MSEELSATTQSPTNADRHVGARIRERRLALGLGQAQLGKMSGRSYQQHHKYETAQNRVSAGVLWEIAQALGTPVEWFFEGLGTLGPPPEMPHRQRMCLELARYFAEIEDPAHQTAVLALARSLATREPNDDQDNEPQEDD